MICDTHLSGCFPTTGHEWGNSIVAAHNEKRQTVSSASLSDGNPGLVIKWWRYFTLGELVKAARQPHGSAGLAGGSRQPVGGRRGSETRRDAYVDDALVDLNIHQLTPHQDSAGRQGHGEVKVKADRRVTLGQQTRIVHIGAISERARRRSACDGRRQGQGVRRAGKAYLWADKSRDDCLLRVVRYGVASFTRAPGSAICWGGVAAAAARAAVAIET